MVKKIYEIKYRIGDIFHFAKFFAKNKEDAVKQYLRNMKKTIKSIEVSDD